MMVRVKSASSGDCEEKERKDCGFGGTRSGVRGSAWCSSGREDLGEGKNRWCCDIGGRLGVQGEGGERAMGEEKAVDAYNWWKRGEGA